MATLVLTVVGGIVGGPIGALVGATAGQAIDRDVLFRPAGRQGPRLSDLSVQTSSYGAMIPKVFGTMRVAGSVVWSTDLVESHATQSSGKGQPNVTTYSYSVSFAVLLSARPIQRVGRIWAEGNLLRGAGGDLKVSTALRIHTGGADQPPDPLIASLEGLAAAPAARGMAYAVFENLQLADYGNRIPSLTFEIFADDGTVTMGEIAAELSGGLVTGSGPALAGFSAYGNDIAGVLTTLSDAAGAWFAADGDGLVLSDTAAPALTLTDDGYAAGGDHPGLTRSIAAIESVPRSLSLGYYDPARDYQSGTQRVTRPGAGTGDQQVDLPAVIDAAAAKGLAERALARAEAGREHRTIRPGWPAMNVAPGACIAIAGAPGVWRVTGWSLEGMALAFDCVRLASGSAAPAGASAGRVSSAPDVAIGTTIVHAFEIPALDDNLLGAPRLTIAAAGTSPGWRGAALLYSVDDGASWTGAGSAAAPATLGTVAVPPGPAGAAIRDLASTIEIELVHAGMMLVNADDAALDQGVNLALAGDELVQFGVAEQLSATRYRLSRLLRGRRGTEAAAGTQAAGDRFVLLTADTVRTIDLPASLLGGTVRVLASGVGDIDGPAAASAMLGGASVLPPAPVHLATTPDTLHWIRRSRAGWRWIDGVDAPLGEDSEQYSVTITRGDGSTRTIGAATPAAALLPEDHAGVAAVRQVGTLGLSPPAQHTI